MNELVHQTRLAYPRFADDRHHLTVTVACELLGAAELRQLDIAADKARQAASGGGLEAGSRGTGARHLVDLHRIGEPLHRHGAEGLHGDVAFRQFEGVGRCKHGTGLCHLFHTSRQMCGLAYDRVVHVQIVADGANDDLA